MVTSTADSGVGSLRQAILDSNAAGGLNAIQFMIPPGPPLTISPLSPLPALAVPVVIDATTQSGFAGFPIVELNGSSAGAGAVGLRVTGGGCTIRGLVINRFRADGIRLDSGNNVIRGNYIGTDVTGTQAQGNGQYGIFLLGTSTNTIGGTSLADRNVISGHNDTGIYVLNGRANVIQGNFIGVNVAGNADLGNVNNGIVLYNAPANTIGGTSPGAGNVISGNDASGIYVYLGAATGNWIAGNYIGVNAAGTAAISNSADGITVGEAPGNLIGGTNAGAGNLISGNGQAGMYLFGLGAHDNVIAGNLIGPDASGATALGNALAGVTLLTAATNRIGGSVAGARNVISGNRQGGLLLSTNSNGNQIQNNFVGVAANGTSRLGNALDGIALDNAAFNQIGNPGAGNLISGNTNNGILTIGVGSSNNAVQGNFIGTDVTGRVALGNGASGVLVESPANEVGGDSEAKGNLISGNGYLGVWLANTNAAGNSVRGNLIGTALGGTNSLGNAFGGVGVSDATNNQIGGFKAAERNVISGNGYPANNGGVFLAGRLARGNRFYGNYIGTDIYGQSALPNRYEGIFVYGASSNIIGSEFAGGGNLISGNNTRGIFITNSTGVIIRGNLIGTKADGSSPLPNSFFGVELEANSSSNSVGGFGPGAGNRIAFNGGSVYAGVRVRDTATNNAILGNSIFSNGALGIDLSTAAVSANDNCDTDPGGNMLQNFPVLTEVYSSTFTTVKGTLNGRANTRFRVQFFSSPSCDASGNGEGQNYLGEVLVNTDANCANSFFIYLPVAIAPGQVMTATATDPANNTSEFSPCFIVQTCPGVDPCATPPTFPVLQINRAGNNQVALSWPATATGFVLQQTDSLIAPVEWTTVTNAPSVVNGQFLVILPSSSVDYYYRLSF